MLDQAANSNQMPPVKVYVDSPLACDVTDVFRQFPTYLDEEAQRLIQSGEAPDRFPGLHYACSVQESKAIVAAGGSKIILAGSGMCTGGRIKHHLRANLERPESTILFVGFQAKGTLGRLILDRADEVRVHGRWYEVRARVAQIFGLSAHGDRDDLLRWIGHFDPPPKRVFLTHGSYLQDWLLESTDQNWRVDAANGGPSRAFADIGSHWVDLAEFVTGLEIEELAADLTTFVAGRRLDDDGNVLLRFKGGAKGVLHASQISAGEENHLNLRVYGELGGFEWRQQEPNTLVVKWLDRPTELFRAGLGYLGGNAAAATRLPAGHPEGYLEAFANLYDSCAELLAQTPHYNESRMR